MSDVVIDAIAASIAELTPVLSVPAATTPYGIDVACFNDINSRASNTTGEAESVIQDAYHRLITKSLPGDSPEEINWGIDLWQYLSAPMTKGKIGSLQSEIAGVIGRDERIASDTITVGVVHNIIKKELTITIRGNLASTGAGFAFVANLGSTSVNATILSV